MFRESGPVLLRNPIFLSIFMGPTPLSPLWIRACEVIFDIILVTVITGEIRDPQGYFVLKLFAYWVFFFLFFCCLLTLFIISGTLIKMSNGLALDQYLCIVSPYLMLNGLQTLSSDDNIRCLQG